MPIPVLPIVLVGGLLAVIGARAVQMRRIMRRLRDAEVRREHDMPRVASYARGLDHEIALLPDRTWDDLDMDEVFMRLDRTASWPGQHLLYARMRREDHQAADLRRFDADVTRLASDEKLRRRIRKDLRPLDDRRASALPFLYQEVLPPTPAWSRAFPLLMVAGAASVARTPSSGWVPPPRCSRSSIGVARS